MHVVLSLLSLQFLFYSFVEEKIFVHGLNNVGLCLSRRCRPGCFLCSFQKVTSNQRRKILQHFFKYPMIRLFLKNFSDMRLNFPRFEEKEITFSSIYFFGPKWWLINIYIGHDRFCSEKISFKINNSIINKSKTKQKVFFIIIYRNLSSAAAAAAVTEIDKDTPFLWKIAGKEHTPEILDIFAKDFLADEPVCKVYITLWTNYICK